jgi:hypothetical protein
MWHQRLKICSIGKQLKSKTLETKKSIKQFYPLVIVSNVISSMNLNEDDDVMRLMYLSLFIYMNECLRLPKSLTMSFGNDLEKHRDEMECGELISNYVRVLYIFSSHMYIFSSIKRNAKLN